MQDFDLIDSVLDGNLKDFELLINKYQPSIFRLSIGLLHNREDAEELTQDVFIKLYLSLSTFNKKSAFSTWLYRLTINTCLNALKKKKKRQFWTVLSETLPFSSNEASAEAAMINRSDDELIKQAIDNLPHKQRLAFILTKYEDLPQREVAAIMKLTEGSVEQLVLRAKNNLRKNLAATIGFNTVSVSKIQRTS
jgi:RNA polymerase sigma-70 factor, ECF subfamily